MVNISLFIGVDYPPPLPLLGCRYRPDSPILQGVSFKVPAGTSCAVVGASGSGKSTILRLLFRFYDVEDGSVLVGGEDVKQLQLAGLRRAMASVPQDMVLFNDTIYYNIAYGNLQATREEIEAAARAAQVGFSASSLVFYSLSVYLYPTSTYNVFH